MAQRFLLLLLAVAAASLLAADARPCHTFFVSLPAFPNPGPDDGAVPHRVVPLAAKAFPNPGPDDGAIRHRVVPRVATVVTVFRVRRLGPHPLRHHGDHHRRPHLHSIPANVQIRGPELPHPAPGAALDGARDILVVIVGLLFGLACGALTAASLYLVWSVLAGAAAAASSPYDQLYDEEEASDTESPKKVGYVIIQELEAHDGGKN